MSHKNGEEKYQHQYNKLVLEIIYKDANESFKFFRDDINSINTKSTLLIGFNAAFTGLLPKLPIQDFLLMPYPSSQELCHLYPYHPYAEPFLKIGIFFINSLFYIKPLIALFLGYSIYSAIRSLLPSPTPTAIPLEDMLEQGKDCSEEDLMIAIIRNRNEVTTILEDKIAQKALYLKKALKALGGAALLTIVLTIIHAVTSVNINIKPLADIGVLY